MQTLMLRTSTLLTCALMITACGSRSLPLADSTTDDSAPQQPDAHAPDAWTSDAAIPPPAICATNDDCPSTQYCQKDGHCVVTGAIAGTCQPRPKAEFCPYYDVCPDVCGCDGKTYCGACEAHAAGVSVATSAACFAATCAGLETVHAAELKHAKQCCAMCAAMQCTITVPGALHCGCDTTINVQTPALQAIRDEWTARGCMFGVPPCGIKCKAPTPGNCALDGYCADGWN